MYEPYLIRPTTQDRSPASFEYGMWLLPVHVDSQEDVLSIAACAPQ